jgi:hypothetical protein
MEKMEMEKEAQDQNVDEARSTFEECQEYDHVQGKPRKCKFVDSRFGSSLYTIEGLHGRAS